MSLTKELLAGVLDVGRDASARRVRSSHDPQREATTHRPQPTSPTHPHPAIDKQPPPAPGLPAAAAPATGAGGVPYDGPTRSLGANSFPLPVGEEDGEGGYYHYLMTRIDEVRGVVDGWMQCNACLKGKQGRRRAAASPS